VVKNLSGRLLNKNSTRRKALLTLPFDVLIAERPKSNEWMEIVVADLTVLDNNLKSPAQTAERLIQFLSSLAVINQFCAETVSVSNEKAVAKLLNRVKTQTISTPI
jgi:hypothetical protein